MDSTKLIALAAAGASSSTLLSGSLFSGSAYGGSSVRLRNPFFGFDLNCTTKKSFSSLDKPEQLIERVEDRHATSKVNLSTPSSTENVQACYKPIFHQTSDWQQIGAARIELAASRGKYGIILLNVIGNVKDYGGRISALRAIFLEKDTKWKIKAGLQWSDEAFLRSSSTTQRLQWNDTDKKAPNKREVVWFKSFDLGELPSEKKHDTLMFSWKPDDSQSQNIYQELTVKPQTPVDSKTQDFWNGNPEPLDTKSGIYKPSAVLEGGVWKKTTRDCCNDLTKVKDWFNLFKDKKGSWEAAKLP